MKEKKSVCVQYKCKHCRLNDRADQQQCNNYLPLKSFHSVVMKALNPKINCTHTCLKKSETDTLDNIPKYHNWYKAPY